MSSEVTKKLPRIKQERERGKKRQKTDRGKKREDKKCQRVLPKLYSKYCKKDTDYRDKEENMDTSGELARQKHACLSAQESHLAHSICQSALGLFAVMPGFQML